MKHGILVLLVAIAVVSSTAAMASPAAPTPTGAVVEPNVPGPVTNFTATPGVSRTVLSWTDSPDSSYTGAMIRYRTDHYPTSISDGTLVVNKAGSPGANGSYTHTGLTNGVNYFYTAFAHDAAPLYSAGVSAWASPDRAPGLIIIPKPQYLTWKTGTGFLINSSTRIVINTSPDDKETNSANELQRKIWDITGFLPAIVRGSAGSSTTNVIAIGTPTRNASVSAIIAKYTEAKGKASKTEGSMMGVSKTSIVIRGFDDAGTFYGCQTLIQLLEYFRAKRIAPLFCYDYPELAWRGAIYGIKFEHDWSFSKELVKEVFVRYKMNRIWPDYYLPSPSHPEINWGADPTPRATLAEALDFTAFCNLHYINVILSWYPGEIVANGQHQDLLENPAVPNVMCMNNPSGRKIMNDLWNEQLNAFTGTQYTPSGYTEIRYMGWDSCPYCGPYSNAQLLSQFMWKDRDYLVPRGVTPVIWGDLLRANADGGMQTHDAVTTMPSEYIIFDWEYGAPGAVPTDYPSLDTWIANGRKACGTPFGFGDHPEFNQRYGGKENIYYWANAVYKRSLTYPQYMLGLFGWSKYIANGKRGILDSPLAMTWLECYPYYAEWGWNPNGRYWNPEPYDGKAMVKREISPDRVGTALVTASAGNVTLSWTNPTDVTFTKTYIVYRTDRQPISPLDGAFLADVAGTPGGASSYVHTGAPSAAYYGLFAHDAVRHFSPVVNVQVTSSTSTK